MYPSKFTQKKERIKSSNKVNYIKCEYFQLERVIAEKCSVEIILTFDDFMINAIKKYRFYLLKNFGAKKIGERLCH